MPHDSEDNANAENYSLPGTIRADCNLLIKTVLFKPGTVVNIMENPFYFFRVSGFPI